MWVAHGSKDPRRARIAFCFRGEGGLFLDRAPDEATLEELSTPARAVYDFLSSEGAALLPDIADGAELDRQEAQQALVELVLAGLVTNDTLAALHAVLGFTPPAATRPGLQSTLQTQLAALMPDHRPRRTPGRLRDARRRAREAVAARLGAPLSSRAGGRDGTADEGYSSLVTHHSSLGAGAGWVGRWSLVHRQSFLGRPLPEGERALRQTRQLLQRWGVVTKACLEREAPIWQWEALYPVLSYLEMRGEVRRGYFVAGLPGLQFALPEVVDQLRAANANRRPPGDAADVPPVVLSAVDPAQLFGTDEVGGALRFARVAATAVALHQGDAVATMAVMDDAGASLSADLDHPALVPCLRALARWWQARQRLRLKVERWQDEPVLPDSPVVAALEAAGFVREGGTMLWVEAPGPEGARLHVRSRLKPAPGGRPT
jgi:ATP-dependent Lhr-like helicase